MQLVQIGSAASRPVQSDRMSEAPHFIRQTCQVPAAKESKPQARASSSSSAEVRRASRARRASWGESELLERVLRKEPSAWSEFIHRYAPVIRSAIDRVTRPFSSTLTSSDRDDIYALTLCALHAREMHRLRVFESGRDVRLSSWISLIARNVTLDYLRRLARQRSMVALSDEAALAEPCTHNPERAAANNEALRRTVDLLGRLSLKDRAFLQLMVIDNLEPEAIARALSISVKTVYTKKHKLRVRLQHLTKGEVV